MAGLRREEYQVTKTNWVWNCPGCGEENRANHNPGSHILCRKCQRVEEDKKRHEQFIDKHSELIGATVLGGTVFYGIQTLELQTKDGQKARIEISLGYEDDAELVVAWEDES